MNLYCLSFGGCLMLVISVNGQSGWAVNEPLCDYPTNYELVWTDDFQGSSIDPNKWKTYASYCPDGTDACVESRLNGPAISRDANIMVSEGVARIVIQNLEAAGLDWSWNSWYGQARPITSGWLHGHFPYNKGRFEIKCRLPGLPNAFPAFWLFGEGGNEIDVFEFCGGDYDDMWCSIHRTAPQNPPLHDTYHALINNDDSFHTYAVEWVDDWVIWYFDGTEVHRRVRYADLSPNDCTLNGPYTRNNFPADGCEMKLIVSMGYNESLCPGFSIETQDSYDIDYVRVYQIPGSFESGHHAICNDPVQIISLTNDRDAFCSAGDVIHFRIIGMHGDPIIWSIGGSSGGALEIIDSNDDECWVRCNSVPGLGGYEPILQALDSENPCQPGRVFRKKLFLGAPQINTVSGNTNGNIVHHCPNDHDEHQYWCIEPEVRGSRGISPYPMADFTTYYGAVPLYNDYDWSEPDMPPPTPTYYSWNEGYRPYQVFVDGVEHTRTFLPNYMAEYWGGINEIGSECRYLPLECQEHWAPWAHGLGWIENPIFCLWKDGDFCHDVKIVAENGCGVVEADFVVTDRCVSGPCNYTDPGDTDIAELVTVFPFPASESFIVRFDEAVKMDEVESVRITDALLNAKSETSSFSNRDIQVDCSGWPPGIYYIRVVLEGSPHFVKLQVK